MPSSSRADKLYTRDDVARAKGVALRTVGRWMKLAGWPAKRGRGKRKYWRRADIDKFCEAHNLGGRESAEPACGQTLTAVRIAKTLESIEREKIARQREQIELAKIQGKILDAEAVEDFHQRLAHTAVTVLASLPDAIARQLPKKPPSAKTWPAYCRRLETTAERLIRDALAVIREFDEEDQ